MVRTLESCPCSGKSVGGKIVEPCLLAFIRRATLVLLGKGAEDAVKEAGFPGKEPGRRQSACRAAGCRLCDPCGVILSVRVCVSVCVSLD